MDADAMPLVKVRFFITAVLRIVSTAVGPNQDPFIKALSVHR